MNAFIEFIWSRRENILLFAASLLISVVLFAQLQRSLEPDKEREIEIPLTFSNQSDDITVLQAPRTVRVIASASQNILDTLDTSSIRAFVDLTGANAGARTYSVEVMGPLRPGLTLSPVRGIVEMHLEPKMRKEFEVEVFPAGIPVENYRFEGATIIPDKVTVSGPESIVPRVKTVRAVLDLTRVLPNQSVDVVLEPLDEQNRPVPLVALEPSSVQVRPAVSIGPSRRALLVTPVFVGEPMFGFRVSSYSIEPNQIEVVGESAEVARVTTVDTTPVDIGGLQGTRRYTVRLRLPTGLTSVSGNEVSVTVRVVRD